MRTVYRSVKGGPLNDKDAELFGKFIRREFRSGAVTADALVGAAQQPDSPIHSYFDWDEEAAAHQWRLEQARKILRSIEVVVQTQSGEETTRAFHVVRNGEQAYVSERVVWRTPEYREQVIERALRELESWRRRYAQYQELSGITAAIEELKVAA